jgi:hypothetical protein
LGRCTTERIVLDYHFAPVGPRARYSGVVVFAFILALMLPTIALAMGFRWLAGMPGWLLLVVPLTVFVLNFCSALKLLNEPSHIRGDGMVCCGVFISGFITLAMMMFLMIARMS